MTHFVLTQQCDLARRVDMFLFSDIDHLSRPDFNSTVQWLALARFIVRKTHDSSWKNTEVAVEELHYKQDNEEGIIGTIGKAKWSML
ncbi:unnamed protein product [Phyllotreta striolata]|uniref:Uncharacterized protein n=1 Tax=Phyllotreta striolata TaxID=444603 RepID=A0A9N9TTR4_PHYSR|nr:unnamed protein product [Phyllotreta striolata]